MIAPLKLADCSSMRDHALYYWEWLGWAIVPIIPEEKRPSILDFVKHPYRSFEDVDIHWQQRERDGIGILPAKCYPPLLVVDVDNKPHEKITTGPLRGKQRDGISSFKKLLRDGTLRPDTTTSKSPSGGYKQLYLSAPVDDSKDMIAPGIEIICSSHQAIIPPSYHPSGKCHEWVHGPEALKPAPGQLLKVILGACE